MAPFFVRSTHILLLKEGIIEAGVCEFFKVLEIRVSSDVRKTDTLYFSEFYGQDAESLDRFLFQ